MRCGCDGDREVETIGSWDHCPLEGGGHTQFLVHKCRKCGGISGFPDQNLQIALDHGIETTKMTLRELLYGNPFRTSDAPQTHP